MLVGAQERGQQDPRIKPVEVQRCKRDAVCRLSDARSRMIFLEASKFTKMEEIKKKERVTQVWSAKPN